MTSAYTADQGRTSVRYASGQVDTRHKFLFFRSDPKPGPGSGVTVPLKDTSNPTNHVALFGAIAQILASTVAIILVATKRVGSRTATSKLGEIAVSEGMQG